MFSNIFLISCNTVRDSAGVNRKVIDEYEVIENPPLIIPPNFDLLPPDQMQSKNINDADSELAKEILFGLNESENDLENNGLLITEIIKATEYNESNSNIRKIINEEFAGEKSTIMDETLFEDEEELNQAIAETEAKEGKIDNKTLTKEKKKKRFFFF